MKAELLSKKINALKTTKDLLITYPDKYNWGSQDTCNCGILAKVIGITSEDMQDASIGCWSTNDYRRLTTHKLGLKRKQTNLPFASIVHTLREHGFYANELRQLEFLQNKKYNKGFKAKYCPSYHTNRLAVIEYLDNWITDLESVASVLLPTKVKSKNTQAVSVSV